MKYFGERIEACLDRVIAAWGMLKFCQTLFDWIPHMETFREAMTPILPDEQKTVPARDQACALG